MSDGIWGKVGVGAAILTFIVSGAAIYISSKSPDVVYEQFPPARFQSDTVELSIYNVAVSNSGNKEASEVNVHFTLPAEVSIQDILVQPSSPAINFETVHQASPNKRQIRFPLLNPSEGARFSLLVDKGSDAQLAVEVRGVGVIGQQGVPDQKAPFSWITFASVAVSVAIGGLVVLGLTKFTQLQEFLQRSASQQLQVIRTQRGVSPDGGRMQDVDIESLIVRQTWRLFYNPRVPGLSKSKPIRFGVGGKILEGNNRNETAWRAQNGLLELLNDQGSVHGRFYYSPTDQRFFSTNDPDIGAITKHRIQDQYLMPEALVNKTA